MSNATRYTSGKIKLLAFSIRGTAQNELGTFFVNPPLGEDVAKGKDTRWEERRWIMVEARLMNERARVRVRACERAREELVSMADRTSWHLPLSDYSHQRSHGVNGKRKLQSGPVSGSCSLIAVTSARRWRHTGCRRKQLIRLVCPNRRDIWWYT